MKEYSLLEIEQIKSIKLKVCSGCGEEKDKNLFGKKPSNIDGREPQCLTCNRRRQTVIRMARKIVINFQ